MAQSTYLHALVCAFTALTLSACGGGGGGGSNDTTSGTPSNVAGLPAEGSLRVDGGNSAAQVGSYQVDMSTASSSGTFQIDNETWQELSPDFSTAGVSFWYDTANSGKFALFLLDNVKDINSAVVYACRSAGWTQTGINYMTARLKEAVNVTVTDLPLCQGSISTSNSPAHIQFNKIALPSVSLQGKSATLSANFGLPTGTVITPPASETLTVESGSTVVPATSLRITGGAGGSISLGGMTLGASELDTDGPVLTLYYPQGQGNKFVLTVSAATEPNKDRETYACASSAWSTADIQNLQADMGGTLTACPNTVNFNASNRLLTLSKASLPELGGSGHRLVLSVNAVMSSPAFPISTEVVSSGF